MELSVQIQSFVASFVFGFLFSYVVNLAYKHLFAGKIIYQIIWNFILVIGSCLLYFYLMKYINQAAIHVYFIFVVVIGFVIGNIFSKKARRIKKFT